MSQRFIDAQKRMEDNMNASRIRFLENELRLACVDTDHYEAQLKRTEEGMKPLSPAVLKEIHNLIVTPTTPKLIEAIKVLRTHTNLGLKAAKEWVEDYRYMFRDKLPF